MWIWIIIVNVHIGAYGCGAVNHIIHSRIILYKNEQGKNVNERNLWN